MHAHAYPQQWKNDSNKFSSMVAVSIVFHLIFFAMAVYLPDRSAPKRFSPRVIDVALVTLPAPAALTQPEEKGPAPAAPKTSADKIKTDPKTITAAQPKSTVSTAPAAQKEKISLKKKTFTSATVIKPGIKRLEKQVAEGRPNQVSQALARLRDKVDKTEATRKAEPKNPAAVLGQQGQSDEDRQKSQALIDIYRQEIAYWINKNWAFSEQLGEGAAHLQTLVVIKVMRDGEIKEIFFTERSGFPYLDESAHKAIIKSNPLPPFPAGFTEPFIKIGFRFTPGGLK